MSVAAGSRLGPYEILAPLGAGSMGEVYRARDGRLGREVAIKVLPAELAGDAERLERFEREARAAAALNHPNILAVHDLGTHEGAPFLVCELLEGAIDPDEPAVLYNLACVYALAGLPERALDCLEQGVGPLFGLRDWIVHDHDLASLRGTPRFEAVLARLG